VHVGEAIDELIEAIGELIDELVELFESIATGGGG
jgi:hypothetical protein